MPVNAVGVNGIDLGSAWHISGDNMDFTAAQPFVHFSRPYSSSTLGGQEEFGEDKQPAHRDIYTNVAEDTVASMLIGNGTA